MKNKLAKLLLIVSFIPIILIIVNIIKVYFFGFEVVMMLGLDIPLCYGFKAVYNYLWFMLSLNCLGIINLPIIFMCIIYQITYYKKEKQ